MIRIVNLPNIVGLGQTSCNIVFENESKSDFSINIIDIVQNDISYNIKKIDETIFLLTFIITNDFVNGNAKILITNITTNETSEHFFVIDNANINNSELILDGLPNISCIETSKTEWNYSSYTISNNINEKIQNLELIPISNVKKTIRSENIEFSNDNVIVNIDNPNISIQNTDYDVPTYLQKLTLNRSILETNHVGQEIKLNLVETVDPTVEDIANNIHGVKINYGLHTTSNVRLTMNENNQTQSIVFVIADIADFDDRSIIITNEFWHLGDEMENSINGKLFNLRLTPLNNTITGSFMEDFLSSPLNFNGIEINPLLPLTIMISQMYIDDKYQYDLFINQITDNIDGYNTNVTTLCHKSVIVKDVTYVNPSTYDEKLFNAVTCPLIFETLNKSILMFKSNDITDGGRDYILTNISFWKNYNNATMQEIINTLSKPYNTPENFINYQHIIDLYDTHIEFNHDEIYFKNQLTETSIQYRKMIDEEVIRLIEVSDHNGAEGDYFSDFITSPGVYLGDRYIQDKLYTYDKITYGESFNYQLVTKIKKVLSKTECIISDIFKNNDNIILSDTSTTVMYDLISYEQNSLKLNDYLVFNIEGLKILSNSVSSVDILHKQSKGNLNYNKLTTIELSDFDILNDTGMFDSQEKFQNDWKVSSNDFEIDEANNYKLTKKLISAAPGLETNKYTITSKIPIYLHSENQYNLYYSVDSENTVTTDNYILIGLTNLSNDTTLISIQKLNNSTTYLNNNIKFYVDESNSYKIHIQLVGYVNLYDIKLFYSDIVYKTPTNLKLNLNLNEYPNIRNNHNDFKFDFCSLINSKKTTLLNNIYVSKETAEAGDRATMMSNLLIYDNFDIAETDINNTPNIFTGINVYLIETERHCVVKYNSIKNLYYLVLEPKISEQYHEIYPVVAGDIWLIKDIWERIGEVSFNPGISYVGYEILAITGKIDIGDSIEVALLTTDIIDEIEIWKYQPETDTWHEVSNSYNSGLRSVTFNTVDDDIYNESYLYVAVWFHW